VETVLDWGCIVLYVLAVLFNAWDLWAQLEIVGIGIAFSVGVWALALHRMEGYAWKESVYLVKSDIFVRFQNYYSEPRLCSDEISGRIARLYMF
jgi:hypothetical protein